MYHGKRMIEVAIRGALPAGEGRGGAGTIECTGLCGFGDVAHQNHRNIVHWWTVVHSNALKSQRKKINLYC